MAPPKHRAARRGRALPRWGSLLATHYETKGDFKDTFRIRRVTSVDLIEEDRRAGTAAYAVAYEYEPLEGHDVDCREYGSAHKEYGEDCRRVDYALLDSGAWTVTKMHGANSGRDGGGAGGAGGAAETSSSDSSSRGRGDLFGGGSDSGSDSDW